MPIQIIVKESNKPTRKALKAFNQYVFEVIKQYQQNEEKNKEGAASNE